MDDKTHKDLKELKLCNRCPSWKKGTLYGSEQPVTGFIPVLANRYRNDVSGERLD